MQAWEEKYYWKQEAREEGLKEGREEGLEKGLKEGEARLGALSGILLKEKRYEELGRALEDTDYRQELYKTYSL